MSNYDPFKLYRKNYKQSYHGQVLQKKPTHSKRAFSRKDLTEAYEVLDAYKIPYGIQPAPPPSPQFQTGIISDTFTTTFRTLNLNSSVSFTNTEFYTNFQQSDLYSELFSLSQSYPDQVYHVFILCSFPVLTLRTYTSYSGISASYSMKFNQIQVNSFSQSYPITTPTGSPANTNIPFSPSDNSHVVYSVPLYVGQTTQQTILTTTVNSSKSLMAYNHEELPLSLLVDADAFAAAFSDVIFEITRTSNPNVTATYSAAINYNLTVVMAPVIDN